MTKNLHQQSWLTGFVSCFVVCAVLYFSTHVGFAQKTTENPAGEMLNINSLNLSKESLDKIKTANDALIAAMEALKAEGKYAAASDVPNATLILSGGGNSMQDLDGGLGVDPETYSLLYANLAAPEIIDKLTKDSQGRLLYNNKVVRLSSPETLKLIVAKRKLIMNYNQFSTPTK